MRKLTTYEFTFGKGKSLPIVAGLVLLPILGIGQTKEQVRKIREKSNISELSKIERSFKKNVLSVNQLKTLAKKRGVEFSGVIDNKKYQLVGFDKWTKTPLYYVTYNADAAIGTSTDKLNTEGGLFNLQGEGMIVHEWDGGGVLTTHREFGGRVIQKDNAAQVVDHSTHVAGTMVASGVDGAAKGMAPKAILHAYEWTDDQVEMIKAAQDGALVSNHSYGMISGFAYGNYSGNSGWHWFGSDDDVEFKGFGKYGLIDRDWDIISLNAPYYLPVRAAGNDRGGGPEPGETYYVAVERNGQTVWEESTKERQKNGGDDGFDVISSGSLGKNVLTVGAAQKIENGYKKPSDVVMASFSSFGPTDDGRIKPDITGIGVDIYSTNSTGDDSYTTMSGTSMASPNVTGSLLLLQEHYNKLNNEFMRSATLKALAIATANEAGQNIGPDYASGWGLLNAYNAVTTISSKDKYSLIKEETLSNEGTNTIDVVASGLEPLKVTIAWEDPVLIDFLMPNPNTLNERRVTLVNDLDVRVLKNGEEYFPWKLDPANPGNAATTGDNTIDNVEQVLIENPEAGATYQIQVKHKNHLKKNEFVTENEKLNIRLVDADSQDYSMVVTGINQGVDTDLALSKVEVVATPKEYTTTTPVKFYVENRGQETAVGGKLKYELLNKDTNEVEQSGEVDIDDLEGNSTSTLEVNLDLSKSFVNYVIKGTVVIGGDEFAFNDTAETDAYGNVASLIPDGATYNYSFENNPVKEGWSTQDLDRNRKSWAKYTDETFAKTGEGFAINFPNSQNGTFNDWLFSNPILVKANTKYRLIYNVRKFQEETEEKIHVYYGDAPNFNSMVNDLGEETITFAGNATRSYDKYYYEFSTTEDKVIYFGFNHAGRGSFAIGLDDITVERAIGKPIVEFKADKVVGTTFDMVSFTSNAVVPNDDPILNYKWEFTPNTVSFQGGTSDASDSPKVLFNEQGVYSVKLKVTNGAGEGVYERAEYVTIANEATKANFAASSSNIYEGETVTFNNMSTGNPEPTEFEWTVTPSEGVEFSTGTTETNLVAKFNNSGLYTVALKAKSVNNEDTYTAENVVAVQALCPAVQNLTSSLDSDTNGLQLNWEEPMKLPIYIENFESVGTTGGVPADMKDYDGNGDGASWFPTDSGYQGTPAIFSLSWYFEFFSADDWFVTPKLRAGAEVLKFMVQNTNPARYDVYLVPVPESGEHPTLEEIKATGVKVYENDLDGASEEFVQKTVDLSGKTEQDFFLAFNHRTKAEDEGLLLVIDNIMVGYNDSPYSVNSDSKPVSKVKVGDGNNLEQLKSYAKNKGNVLVDFNLNKYKQKAKKDIKINFGVTDFPTLTGYRVEKDDVTKEEISGMNNTTYSETLDEKGTYTYNVYAVYSDGESEPVSITVDASSLATAEVEAGTELQVYPNPSNGMFVVMNESSVSSFTTEVYNMAGQVIYQNKFNGNKTELNLTKFPAGVYVLKVVDNKGVQKSVKLIIK